MSNRNRTPSAFEPYLTLPPELSLVLLTSTLGCSANWLTARFAASALTNIAPEDPNFGVIFVSWLRDETFWREQFRRAGGVDTTRLRPGTAFAFVDCLSDSLAPRNPDSELEDTKKKIVDAIAKCSGTVEAGSKLLLILDAPDTLLAVNASIGALNLSNLLLRLRSRPEIHATILSAVADVPLLSQDNTAFTPLEAENAAFLLQQAYQARLVMSVRELDTGAARDVSGVLRITRGGQHGGREDTDVKEMERLYLVQRDGGVKMVE